MTADKSMWADIVPDGMDGLEEYFSGYEEDQKNLSDKAIEEKIKKNRDKYEKATNNILHDEPWLTLMALYGLFGNQKNPASAEVVQSVNRLMAEVFDRRAGKPSPPIFDSLTGARVEVFLKENKVFQDHLREVLTKANGYHPYWDIKQKQCNKLNRPKESLEGNTNLDAMIRGESKDERDIRIFIEAKFLSDISTSIKYMPVRNQIARNIDCAMDVATKGGTDLSGLKDFWFLLLTPGIFRTAAYGGHTSSPIEPYRPERSRFYCYKMDEYLDPDKLRAELPHWDKKLTDEQWKDVCGQIGWLTFEDVGREVVRAGVLTGERLRGFREFFEQREIGIE